MCLHAFSSVLCLDDAMVRCSDICLKYVYLTNKKTKMHLAFSSLQHLNFFVGLLDTGIYIACKHVEKGNYYRQFDDATCHKEHNRVNDLYETVGKGYHLRLRLSWNFQNMLILFQDTTTK